ncbi:hypothetical protein [Polaribacter atrinae]|uniref:hypothetical protein n=1 Tax=Polaribacter atrinae TaxID=1333662 RepID=UPI00248F6FE2|nr:hypothetical protein [Polaribacter atrinae]
MRKIAAAGFEKITFAGGEPMLCPWLPKLIKTAKELGLTTMIVTNGSQDPKVNGSSPVLATKKRLIRNGYSFFKR